MVSLFTVHGIIRKKDSPPRPRNDLIEWKFLEKRDTFSFTVVSLVPRIVAAAAAAKSLLLCLTLCNPIDSSPPGSSVLRTL